MRSHIHRALRVGRKAVRVSDWAVILHVFREQSSTWYTIWFVLLFDRTERWEPYEQVVCFVNFIVMLTGLGASSRAQPERLSRKSSAFLFSGSAGCVSPYNSLLSCFGCVVEV